MRRRILIVTAALACLLAGSGIVNAESSHVTGSVTGNPLVLQLDPNQDSMSVGQPFRISGSLTNLSGARATDLTVTLRAEPTTMGAQGGFAQTVRQLRPLGDSGLGWRLCSNAASNYIVMATVSGTVGDTTFTADSNAILVTIAPGGRTCTPAFEFAPS